MPQPTQLLSSMQVRDLKSFSDSGPVQLKKINLLIGANNAGKSTFLGAIELFFRSMRSGALDGPLAFETMPTFASFDSALRRHWNRNTPRPTQIALTYQWMQSRGKASETRRFEFLCSSQGKDDAIVVSEATYFFGNDKNPIVATRFLDSNSDRGQYVIKSGRQELKAEEQWFHQLVPYEAVRLKGRRDAYLFGPRMLDLEIVNPYRPVPRSFYVLDDPNLAAEDRSLLTYLIRLWASKDAEERAIRERISSSLAKLNLTQHFDISQVSKRIGPKVIEIRVSPTSSRQKVTIADAGFGLSQFLPLAVYDARLTSGTLLAYQPEVHLHPFAQSRLADIFAESAARGNQLFVETHSVDLILRLQAKIAKGEVDPSDVAVLCFENRNGRTEVSPMSFDESGIPSKSWPKGFLDTGLELARELTSARLARLQSKNRQPAR